MVKRSHGSFKTCFSSIVLLLLPILEHNETSDDLHWLFAVGDPQIDPTEVRHCNIHPFLLRHKKDILTPTFVFGRC